MTWISAGSRIGYGTESAWGTKADITKSFGITNQSISLPDIERDVRQYRSFGTGRKYFLNKAGRHERKANIPFLPTNGAFLYYTFGTGQSVANPGTVAGTTPSSVVNASGVLTRTIVTANTATLPSFTMGTILERGSNNFLRTWTGGMVDDMTLSLSESSELSASMGAIHRMTDDETTADSGASTGDGNKLFTQPQPTDATGGTSGVPYMFYDRGAGVTMGSKAVGRVTSFSCSIRNNLRTNYFLSSSATTALTDTFFSATNGSTGVTASSAQTLAAGTRIKFGSQTTTYYLASAVSASTSLTLSTTYKGATGAGLTAATIDIPPQEVGLITTAYPDFDLSFTMVPEGHTNDNNSIYDTLLSETPFNVSIPFTRSANDSLTLNFYNCMLRSAPHPLSDDGSEIVVNASFVPTDFQAVVVDQITSY